MPSLHATISRLKALREGLAAPAAADDHLSSFQDFGSNPGALEARAYVPKALRSGAPLVVVLHGCTQTASGYDRSAAWSTAAEEHGFALLFPEQQRSNNPNLCFNWFSPEDARRGDGEALSIRQMVAAMQARHGTDSGKVFVTGLSAGGAMAAVMLATYPEVFAGGAIIAGLPFGVANSIPEAFEAMRGNRLPSSDVL
ncbi:MAG TPA: PHB depolymerase family esterase, partial [Sphingomicrobium sp.]